MDATETFAPLRQRHAVPEGKVVVAVLERGTESAPLEGRLIDLSQNGARVAATSPPQFEERVHLKILGEKGDLTAVADVRWIRPGGEGQWVVGLAFLERLSHDVVQSLGAQGVVERRAQVREPLSGTLLAKWEGKATEVEVELCNLSRAGLCVLAPEPARPGQRVLFAPTDDRGPQFRVRAETRWVEEAEQEFLVGCWSPDGQWPAPLRQLAGLADTLPVRRRLLSLFRRRSS